LVFSGGDPPDPRVADQLPAEAIVIAADSGVEHALALGRKVDLVIGDLDSADPFTVDAAVADGSAIERHPVDKDRTDLELALEAAQTRGARTVVVIGGYGGRLDHFLANALLLASMRFADLRITALVGDARITVVHDRAVLDGKPGDLLSLLAVGGPARGVHTEGLRFALRGEELLPGSSRGVSNELTEPVAIVTLEHGTLLAVQPDPGRP
jgi:thiamine pyrophosphokinase